VAKALLRAEEIAKQLRDGTLSQTAVVSESVWEFAQRIRARESNRASTETRWAINASHWRDSVGALSADSVTRRDIEEWYGRFIATTKLQPSSANLILANLKWVLRRLHVDGLTASDLSTVCRALVVNREARENLSISDLAPAFSGAWAGQTYFAVLAVTGMRRGELEKATMNRWSPPFLTLRPEDTKTNVGRSVPIPLELHSEFERLLQSKKSRGQWQYLGKRGFTAAGFPNESIHSLRRMCISDMARIGVRRGVIKALVGHTGGDMTDHYDGPAGSETLRAVEHYWAECVRRVYRNEPKTDNQ
jgi:integrase